MRVYSPPVIVVICLLGNCVLFVTYLKHSALRKHSYSVHVVGCATSNNLYLIWLFLHWLRVFDISAFNRGGVCQLSSFFRGSSAFLSTWFLVALLLDCYVTYLTLTPTSNQSRRRHDDPAVCTNIGHRARTSLLLPTDSPVTTGAVTAQEVSLVDSGGSSTSSYGPRKTAQVNGSSMYGAGAGRSWCTATRAKIVSRFCCRWRSSCLSICRSLPGCFW